VVADEYLKSILDPQLHRALALLSNLHVIHVIDSLSRPDANGRTYYISCEMDCGDRFKPGEVQTDDNACVTLKLAILGGYVPEKWSDDD
jgi:hypothetical protein